MTHQRTAPVLGSFLGLVAGTLPLAAQTQAPPADDHRIEWPSGLSSITGTMSRVILGDFQGNHFQHAIVLRGGVPVMIHQPGYLNCLSALSGSGWVDLVTVPASGGGVDEIAFTDGAGLKLTEYDALTEDLVTATLVSGNWRNATQLVMADLDGTAPLDIVGVGQTGKDVVTLVNSGSGYSAGDSLSFVPQVSGFAVGDFDTQSSTAFSDLEIAVVLPAKVKVYQFDGTLLASYDHSGNAEITAIPRQGGAGDIGVLATDDVTSGEYLLYAFDTSGMESGVDLEWDFNGPDPGGDVWAQPITLHPCVADGDSLVDVVVRCGDINAFAGYSVSASAPPHFVQTLDPWIMSPAGTNNDNVAAVGPLGTSGLTGAIAPMQNADALYVVNPMVQPVTVTPPEAELIEFFQPSWYEVGGPEEGDDLSLEISILSTHLTAADHLQLILWRQDDPAEPLSRAAVSNNVYPVSAGPSTYTSVACLVELEDEDATLGPSGHPTWPAADHHHYYIEARLVEASGIATPSIDEVHETYLAGLTVQQSEGDLDYDDYLTSRSTALSNADAIQWDVSGSGNPVHIGTIVSLGRLPDFGPLAPRPGTPKFASTL